MQDKLYTDLLYVLVALLVAAILGYLIGRMMKSIKLATLKKSLDACYKENEELKNSTNDSKKVQSTYIPSDRKSEPVAMANSSISKSYDNNTAKQVLGKSIKENDLKVVEGIGPKIEELLNKDGIITWNHLSKAPILRLQNILKNGGDRFLFHKPDSWPKQAKLADEGKWEELKKLQDYLDGGKEPSK